VLIHPYIDPDTRFPGVESLQGRRITMIRNALHLVLLSAVCGAVHAQSVVGAAGLLTDAAGRVLYTFDKDSTGKSACYDQCAALWPPFVAAADARATGEHTLVTRSDGSRQWAIRGKPLYYYVGDSEAGQRTGDGRGGVWHVVREGSAPPADHGYRPKGY
jgi:predicted lipoprotein with Yx(FWY)xxD motif